MEDNTQNLAHIGETSVVLVDEAPLPINLDIDKDIEEARAVLKELVAKGQEGLVIAFDILEGSEHPKAVDSFSNLIKSIAYINSQIIDLQETKQKLQSPIQQDNSVLSETHQNIQQNNIYCGSTADVMKLISNN